MEFMDVLLKRRSTRKFNTEPITKEELDYILKARMPTRPLSSLQTL